MRSDGSILIQEPGSRDNLVERGRDAGLFVGRDTYQRLDHEEAPWNQAPLVGDLQDPMSATAAWQLSAHEVWGQGRPVIHREDGSGQVVVALKDLGARRYELQPLETTWRFGQSLVGEGSVELLALLVDAATRALDANSRRIVLTGLAPNSPILDDLHACFGRRYDLWLSTEPAVQGAASLDGGIDGFLSRRSGNFRRKLRQQQRRAAELGVTFEHLGLSTPLEAELVYARMIAVEQRSWKGRLGCGMDSPGPRQFYAAMLRRLASLGRARVAFATRDEQDIGFIFGGVVGSIYRGQQFSFDWDWADVSVGNLLQFEQVARLCEEGITRYDLGPLRGPKMAYKIHWAERQLPLVTCELQAINGSF
jgi:CelD/BcsL family acetyltransferase involved in cellulose biosynthesis